MADGYARVKGTVGACFATSGPGATNLVTGVATAYRVSRPGELKKLLPEALASGKTIVIDCIIDPNEVPPLAPFVEGAQRFIQQLDFA